MRNVTRYKRDPQQRSYRDTHDCAHGNKRSSAQTLTLRIDFARNMNTNSYPGNPMRISERGQVTIPRAIREEFGLLPDTEVEFVVRDGTVQLIPSPTARSKAIDRLYGRKRFDRTTDELMALLRE